METTQEQPKSSLQEALAKVKSESEAKKTQELQWVDQITELDWKKLPPPLMAQILCKKPYRGKKGEPDYYLSREQALVFAMRAFELGLSPLSSEIWFNRDTWQAQPTSEGQRKICSQRQINCGPPKFQALQRPWQDKNPKIMNIHAEFSWLEQEIGYSCTVKVLDQECNYIAWLSEWYMPGNPNWRDRPEHMLQVRSSDKCYEFVTGVGVSAVIEDQPSDSPLITSITSTPVTPSFPMIEVNKK